MTTQNTNQPASSSWMFELDAVQSWAYCEDLFSKVECEKIIEIGNSKLLTPGIVGNKELKKDVRDCGIAWLYPGDDLNWVFQRIAGATDALNKQFFNFDIYGMVEGLQFTKYEAPSGHYSQHTDQTPATAPRKLSITIQLNDSADFEGGALSIITGTPTEPEMKQGKLVIFPSYTLHEVKPVTKGTRYSLVCWIVGKPFK